MKSALGTGFGEATLTMPWMSDRSISQRIALTKSS